MSVINRKTFSMAAVAVAVGLTTFGAQSASRPVVSLTITGGDFAMGAPGVGACSTNPGDFANFKCLTGGNTTPMMMGTYQPASLTAFNFFAAPVTTFTAASATGAAPNPTGTPNGTVDDATNAMTLDFGGWYAQWSGTNFLQGTNPNNVFATSTAATGTCANIANNSCTFDIRWNSYITTPPFAGQTGYWHLTGTAVIEGIVQPINAAPVVTVQTISLDEGTTASFSVTVTDANASDSHTCAVTTQAANGTASVAADCSSGSFTAGQVDADTTNTFVITATDNNSVNDPAGTKSGTGTGSVTIRNQIVQEPCTVTFPQKSITTNGGGQSSAVNATLSTTFTGHITSNTNNSVKLCPSTTATYDAVSTVGTANCTVSGSAAAASGTVAPGQKLICTNSPTGSDTDRFRILVGP